jgi:hypothetical protein
MILVETSIASKMLLIGRYDQSGQHCAQWNILIRNHINRVGQTSTLQKNPEPGVVVEQEAI